MSAGVFSIFDGVGYAVGRSLTSFPTQFPGLRVWWSGAAHELCLVAEADAPAGMGAVIKVRKSGANLALYLVEIGDPFASPVRVKTTTGVKAIRLKT